MGFIMFSFHLFLIVPYYLHHKTLDTSHKQIFNQSVQPYNSVLLHHTHSISLNGAIVYLAQIFSHF